MLATGCRLSALAGLAAVLLCILAGAGQLAVEAQKTKCQGEECELKEDHFRLYSIIKGALDSDFTMKGKDIIPLMRSVDVLRSRFVSAAANQPEAAQLNGTQLILGLLESEKLRQALKTFSSDEGRALINLYRGRTNGNRQKLACSQWRVGELEYAARKLEEDAKLAKVFVNVHRVFVERSARQCLKKSCSSIDELMKRLDSAQRHQSRRKGFVAREDVTGKLYDESSGNSLDELAARVENEPAGEFQREELLLCQFFKRTDDAQCQASGSELSAISFLKPVEVNNETIEANLEDYLRAFRQYKAPVNSGCAKPLNNGQCDKPYSVSDHVLAQCRSIQPLLSYHTFGLRWYQRKGLITNQRLLERTFWCPSLSYWLEIDRLCNELETKLAGGKSGESGGRAAAMDANQNTTPHIDRINLGTFVY